MVQRPFETSLRGRPGSRRAAFLAGLLTPSLLALAITIAITLGLLTLVLLGMKSFAASPYVAYAANGPRDHSVWVTSRVLRLQAAPPDTRRPLLAIIGASVTRSSFGTERQIAAAMREATGRDVEVAVLATGLQGIVEHIEIVEALLTGRPTWFVVGVGPSRVAADVERSQKMVLEPEVGFRTPAVNDYARVDGLKPFEASGSFLVDNYKFWLARLTQIPLRLVLGPPRQDQTTWLGRRMPPTAFRDRADLAATRLATYDANVARNLALLEHLADRLKAHPEAHLTLVEHAINPVFVRDWMGEDFYAAHIARMRSWARAHDIDYVTLALDAQLEDADFFDWAHLSRPEAVARLRTDLTRHLAEEPLQ